MPELPEVETLRRDLEGSLAGRRIVRVVATGERTFRRQPDRAGFEARTVGRQLVAVGRRGKYLLVKLDGPDLVVIHLRMSGQLLVTAGDTPLARHTHAIFGLDSGEDLRFVDPRTFGEVFVSAALPYVGVAGAVARDGAAGECKGWTAAELAHIGVEPLDPALDPLGLGRLLRGHRRALKALLLDQSVVAGVGNIYADEILWCAELRPTHRSDRLTRPAVARLHDAMVTVLSDAIAHRGSSLADAQYRDLYGRLGSYQERHRVHGHAGEACPRCGGEIRRLSVAGRTTYFCRGCQR